MKRTFWYAAQPKGMSGDRARMFIGMGAGFQPAAGGCDLAAVTATSNHKNVRPTGLRGSSPG